ncbi:MAG: GNAT family N-acetyltransferase [Burkholderiales bacterium]|nr:GNAT family N-acetyltransferase [Burkholderiales bacterium]
MAELSEAHAYVAMARAAAADAGGSAVSVFALADGIALQCPGDRSSTLFNRVLGLGLSQPFDARTMAAVAARFGGHQGPWGLELAPTALHEHVRLLLKQMRLRRSLPTAMLAMDCRDLDGPAPAWRVERVGADRAALAAEVVERVFGISASVARILRRAPWSPEFAQWVAFDGARPVAACLTHVRGDTAWFGWSATLPSHRARGLQSALLWHSVRDAGERGCRWMTAETATGTVDAPDASFRNMKRFGFVELYRRHGYLCLPPRGARADARSAASWARSRF